MLPKNYFKHDSAELQQHISNTTLLAKSLTEYDLIFQMYEKELTATIKNCSAQYSLNSSKKRMMHKK